jgi:hypothetical protein
MHQALWEGGTALRRGWALRVTSPGWARTSASDGQQLHVMKQFAATVGMSTYALAASSRDRVGGLNCDLALLGSDSCCHKECLHRAKARAHFRDRNASDEKAAPQFPRGVIFVVVLVVCIEFIRATDLNADAVY